MAGFSQHGQLLPVCPRDTPEPVMGTERNAGTQVSPGARIYPIPPLNSTWTLRHPWPEKGLVTPGSDPSGMTTSDPTKQTPGRELAKKKSLMGRGGR